MVYWSPERSLANAANGGFLPSGPSAPADCWAMGCVASELVSGVFVQERLASSSCLSLAQEPKVVESLLRAITDAASCHQGGQAAAKGGGGETCAALRTAWVMVGLLERDPMRRLEAGRAAFLLETPTWVQAPEATTVGSSRCSTMVPALSIPPPSRRRRGDSGDGEASGVSHVLPGVDMLSAVRRAIDGPDWRVFKDGKLVANESQWHHDDLTTARSRERRASSPHPRAIRSMYAAENDGRIPEVMDDGGNGMGSVLHVEHDTDTHMAPSAPLSARQQERAERQQTRKGLADLYLQAKQKQFPGADDDKAKANAPSRDAAIHASSERRNANGVDAAAPPVPLSSLKEDKAKRRGHGDGKRDARAAKASALPPALLSSLSLPDASKRPYDMQAQDVWHAWLKSLGADVPDLEGEEEEDTPSQSASSAHAWSEGEPDEDTEAVDVGEMGPQEVADADMQMKDFLSPRLLVPDSRGITRGNGVGLAAADGDDEQEDAARGRRGWVGGRGQEEQEPAGSNADGMKGDAGDRERQTAGSSLTGWHEEATGVSKTENFLSQHLVSVKNVAGNTVHVIGAAAPASEEEADTHSAPGRPHSQSIGQFSASSPNPHPSPDDEEDGTSGAPEEGRGGIVAKGVGGAEVEIKAKLLTSRSVGGGDGGSGAGMGDGREVYTVFVLSCEGAGVEWQVCRRYSEFSELHLKLMSSLPPAKGRASRARAALSSRMPKKVMFGSNLPHVVAERLEKLRSYVAALQRVLALQVLNNAKDAEKACEAWVQFCAVPSTAFAAAALGRSGHGFAASVAVASSPPHPAAVNALDPWAASAKPLLRSVLRRGALSGERQEAAKNKKVVVEEGRRQVVWGTDGVLQLDANTFISGTPERLAGAYTKAAKKGNKPHRRAVDPAGPFVVGWWEDETSSDPPAQKEADDTAQRCVSADAAPAAALPASKLDATLAPDSSPGKKSAAVQASKGDGEGPVLAVLTDGELCARKLDGQGSRTLSLLRDLDHVSRGRGPDRFLSGLACFSFGCALLFVPARASIFACICAK